MSLCPSAKQNKNFRFSNQAEILPRAKTETISNAACSDFGFDEIAPESTQRLSLLKKSLNATAHLETKLVEKVAYCFNNAVFMRGLSRKDEAGVKAPISCARSFEWSSSSARASPMLLSATQTTLCIGVAVTESREATTVAWRLNERSISV